jgi:hypothetical protein
MLTAAIEMSANYSASSDCCVASGPEGCGSGQGGDGGFISHDGEFSIPSEPSPVEEPPVVVGQPTSLIRERETPIPDVEVSATPTASDTCELLTVAPRLCTDAGPVEIIEVPAVGLKTEEPPYAAPLNPQPVTAESMPADVIIKALAMHRLFPPMMKAEETTVVVSAHADDDRLMPACADANDPHSFMAYADAEECDEFTDTSVESTTAEPPVDVEKLPCYPKEVSTSNKIDIGVDNAGDDPSEESDLSGTAEPPMIQDDRKLPASPKSRSQNLPNPSHIDTTEFRPSDALPGQFDRRPF